MSEEKPFDIKKYLADRIKSHTEKEEKDVSKEILIDGSREETQKAIEKFLEQEKRTREYVSGYIDKIVRVEDKIIFRKEVWGEIPFHSIIRILGLYYDYELEVTMVLTSEGSLNLWNFSTYTLLSLFNKINEEVKNE